jgi:hypothetical protein
MCTYNSDQIACDLSTKLPIINGQNFTPYNSIENS